MRQITIEFAGIAKEAGYLPGPDGKLNLASTQETADALARASVSLLPPWFPGDEEITVIVTGPGPIWGYLTIAHALHGRVSAMYYASPACAPIKIFGHGA